MVRGTARIKRPARAEAQGSAEGAALLEPRGRAHQEAQRAEQAVVIAQAEGSGREDGGADHRLDLVQFGAQGDVLLVQVDDGQVVAIQLVVIVAVALALDWDPDLSEPLPAVAGVVLAVGIGTTAFAALGLFVAGVLRAEATLALANLVYLLLLAGGGDVSRMVKIGTVAEAQKARKDLEKIIVAWCDSRDAAKPATKKPATKKPATRSGRAKPKR